MWKLGLGPMSKLGLGPMSKLGFGASVEIGLEMLVWKLGLGQIKLGLGEQYHIGHRARQS